MDAPPRAAVRDPIPPTWPTHCHGPSLHGCRRYRISADFSSTGWICAKRTGRVRGNERFLFYDPSRSTEVYFIGSARFDRWRSVGLRCSHRRRRAAAPRRSPHEQQRPRAQSFSPLTGMSTNVDLDAGTAAVLRENNVTGTPVAPATVSASAARQRRASRSPRAMSRSTPRISVRSSGAGSATPAG